jgi:predicted AlkP superfamily pyrophosphatase or phosphodiesterase
MPNLVFIMTDGMRTDALSPERTPTFHQFMQRGAYTLNARSVVPSITLPCHTSIFHSIPPHKHGIQDNEWLGLAQPVVGLVEQLAAAGKRSAYFYNWEQLRDLNRPGTLYFSHFENTGYELDGDGVIVDAAIPYIQARRFDFTFVYIGAVDLAGHVYNWMSDDYLRYVQVADGLAAKVLQAVSDEDIVLIHSDHGGGGAAPDNHGSDKPEDMTIPWMIAGPGIRQGHAIQRAVSLLDTAPTIARILGVTPVPEWEGTAVDEVFAE